MVTKLASIFTIVLLFSACTGSIEKTTTKRASEEQLYLSTAAEQSVSAMNFTVLSGRRVFIDEQYLKCIDQSYVVSLVREQAMIQGCKLTKTKDTSEAVIELRSGGLGTYARDLTIGIPSVLVPGEIYENPDELPIIAEIGYSLRQGWANVQGFAYESKTGKFISGSGNNFGLGYKGFLFDNIYPETKLVESLTENIK